MREYNERHQKIKYTTDSIKSEDNSLFYMWIVDGFENFIFESPHLHSDSKSISFLFVIAKSIGFFSQLGTYNMHSFKFLIEYLPIWSAVFFCFLFCFSFILFFSSFWHCRILKNIRAIVL